MKQSITYYITLLVIKLKGIKRDFSQDPIDFKKIRKADVPKPKNNYFKTTKNRDFKVLKSSITEIGQKENSKSLLIYVHGGAFISGPAIHHWDTLKEIHKETNHTIWMCDYPKAPETTISEISKNIDAVFHKALEQYSADDVLFMGDSAGGTLISTLMQRLIAKQESLPKKIILISPVMDASMTNPEIALIDKRDPMLSQKGVLSAKKMCSENENLRDPQISPIHGSFEKFPTTILFLAENDITYPDQKIAVKKLTEAGVPVTTIMGENMPHIWPLLPVMKEAKEDLHKIISFLNNH